MSEFLFKAPDECQGYRCHVLSGGSWNFYCPDHWREQIQSDVTAAIGHYNSHISWPLEHGQADPQILADIIAGRDSAAIVNITGMRPIAKDQHIWEPLLVEQCKELVAKAQAAHGNRPLPNR